MVERQVLLLGCGYVATRVAGLPGIGNTRVTARREDRLAELVEQGMDACFVDLDASPVALPDVAGVSILYSVPPPPQGQQDTRMQAFLLALEAAGKPERIVLISTTGVYGNCHGEQPVKPQVDRARRRVDAEQQMRNWCELHGVQYVILRVPGIYGPDKLPEKRIRAAKPVLCPEVSPWSNRVHVHDLARACVAALGGGEGIDNAIFNISDNRPSTMTDYFYRVADYLGLPRPPCIGLEQARAEMSEGMLGYLAESKRIDNTRMRTVLGVEPDYPDLEHGLPLERDKP